MKRLFMLFSVLLGVLSVFSQQQTNQSIRKLNTVMYAIENLYVDKVDDDKLTEDAIVALLDKLDPHSNYINQEEAKEMNEPLQGNFDGIGIQFNMLTDTLYVVSVISGGPSEKVGLLAGDRIIQVDDTLIAGVKMKNNDIMKRLRGPKGTMVRVKVLRNKESNLLEFKIIRDKIPIYSLESSYMADKEIGYIRLNRFAATSHDEFVKAFKALQAKGMKSLILDLQGNGGGYLNAAFSIANEFLGGGKLIVYTEGARQKREDFKANATSNFETGKLVVLVDETSASASEIVSGAVQDWDRGVIVGRRSFGKGLVQRPIPLPDGSMIRLTTARYYTPTGRCIQKPYQSGDLDSYNKDLIERYNHGEMLSADSIHFPDSLKYNTLVNKRVVYGGGGIMPDYFIPFDTARYTDFHRQIVASGIINKYIMNLVDKNRNAYLKDYKNVDQFNNKFVITDVMMQDLLDMALEDKKASVPKDSTNTTLANSNTKSFTTEEMEQYSKSKPIIMLQLKALIARDLWEMNEYFQIMNQDNDSFKRALEILHNPEEYNKLLGQKQK